MDTTVQEALETPATSVDNWITKAPMPLARSYAASGVIDGKIYSIGGGIGASASDDRSDINLCYDPADNRWEERASMPTLRHGAGGAVVDGKLHVIGGCDSSRVDDFLTAHEVYDPGTNRWQALAGLPVARALVKTVAVNGRIHALGGSKRQGTGAGPCQDHTVYDPTTDRWTVLPDMPEPKLYHAVAAVRNKIYVLGGDHRSPNNFVYNTTLRTWSRIAPCPQLVAGAGVATLGGKIYLVGGAADRSHGTPLTLVQVYDPAKDSWEKLPAPLPHPRQALVAAGLGETLYAIGGAIFSNKTFDFNTALQVNTGGMRRVGAADLSRKGPLFPAVMDPGTGYAFLGSGKRYSRVLKVRLGGSSTPPTFVVEGRMKKDIQSFHSGIMAKGFAYFGSNFGHVFKIAPGTGDHPPTQAGFLERAAGGWHLTSAVVDEANDYAYFGTDGDPFCGKNSLAHIVKVHLGTAGPTRIDGFTVSDKGSTRCAAIDAAKGFAYFGIDISGAPGRIVKVALGAGSNPPTPQGLLYLDQADGHPVSAVLDPLRGFAYFGTDSAPGRVIQVRLSDFQHVSTLTLERGEDNLACAVIDAVKGYAYFGTFTGRVVKVSLGDGTNPPAWIESLKLQPEETDLRSAVIDTARGFACFGTGLEDGRFVKVTLGD